MPRRRRPSRSAIAVVTALVGALIATGCGHEVGRTALVPRHPRWTSPTTLVVDVECSDRVEASVRVWGGVEFLPLVTIWGEPNRDRCWTEVVLEVPPKTFRIDDAASGTVIDLPPPPEA